MGFVWRPVKFWGSCCGVCKNLCQSSIMHCIWWILAIGCIHVVMLNPLEKLIIQDIFGNHNRPTPQCEGNPSFWCQGMPSGHTEVIAVAAGMLYAFGFVKHWIAILAVMIVGVQRVIARRHTVSQVVVGALLGAMYAACYARFGCGMAFTIALTIGVMLGAVHVLAQPWSPLWPCATTAQGHRCNQGAARACSAC